MAGRARSRRRLVSQLARVNASNDKSGLLDVIEQIREPLFDKQLDLIDDGARYKAVLCSRRAGKTHCLARYLFLVAIQTPGVKVIYITITKSMAKNLLWGELKRINKEYDIRGKEHGTECHITLANGSVIMLGGADNKTDIDKYRGDHFKLVVLDEGKSFYPGLLEELVTAVLAYTLLDDLGTLVVSGTPGTERAGFFWSITDEEATFIGKDVTGLPRARSRPFEERDDARWRDVAWDYSLHRWHTADNSAKKHIWKTMLAEHKASGIPDNDPTWVREGLGRWVDDPTARVYRYVRERNSWRPDVTPENPFGLPEEHDWRFVAGIDLGFDDDFDIEVAAYSPTFPEAFHVYGFASPGLTIKGMMDEYAKAEAMFGRFDMVVGDTAGLGKMIFQSIEEMYGLSVEPARKSDKRDYIELLNSDFMAKRVWILAGSTLEKQYETLVWDKQGHRKIEDRSCPNHATDAFLYLVRAAQHHFYRTKEPAIKPGTEAYAEWFNRDQARQAEEMEGAPTHIIKRLRGLRRYEHRLSPFLKKDEDPWN